MSGATPSIWRCVNSVVCSTTHTRMTSAEADAADHGTGTGGYLSTFTTVSASRSTTGRSVGVACDRAAGVDRAHDGADHEPRGYAWLAAERDRDVALLQHDRRCRAVVDHREAQEVAVALPSAVPFGPSSSPWTSCAPTPKLRVVDALHDRAVRRHAHDSTDERGLAAGADDHRHVDFAMPDDDALRDARTCARSCPAPAPTTSAVTAVPSAMSGRSRICSQLAQLAPAIAFAAAICALRRVELLAELLVLVLQLVGAPEAVDPVGGRVDHVVGERPAAATRRPAPRCGPSR